MLRFIEYKHVRHQSLFENIFLFQHSDKAALLFRQYVKDSLYDRISTRPFLNRIEKKWLAFQLLCALNQCHKIKVSIFIYSTPDFSLVEF